jgi:hypothetical protein
MRIVVRDPWGFDHRLEHDGERWWGCENLTHGTAAAGRGALIEKVVRAVATGRPLPAGYGKVVQVSGQGLPAPPAAAVEASALVIEAESYPAQWPARATPATSLRRSRRSTGPRRGAAT